MSPTLVSKAATENRINAKYWPRKSSRKIEANMKFTLTPNKIISKANNTKSRFGFNISIRTANITNINDRNSIYLYSSINFGANANKLLFTDNVCEFNWYFLFKNLYLNFNMALSLGNTRLKFTYNNTKKLMIK